MTELTAWVRTDGLELQGDECGEWIVSTHPVYLEDAR